VTKIIVGPEVQIWLTPDGEKVKCACPLNEPILTRSIGSSTIIDEPWCRDDRGGENTSKI